jgi:hypothetical protein
MENIKTIVNGTQANLSHVCNGKACYWIKTADHSYQLEINLMTDEWKDVDVRDIVGSNPSLLTTCQFPDRFFYYEYLYSQLNLFSLNKNNLAF